MIKIYKRSELQGAEKFGNCASCSCDKDKRVIYKIEFKDETRNKSSLSLCSECILELEKAIKLLKE